MFVVFFLFTGESFAFMHAQNSGEIFRLRAVPNHTVVSSVCVPFSFASFLRATSLIKSVGRKIFIGLCVCVGVSLLFNLKGSMSDFGQNDFGATNVPFTYETLKFKVEKRGQYKAIMIGL